MKFLPLFLVVRGVRENTVNVVFRSAKERTFAERKTTLLQCLCELSGKALAAGFSADPEPAASAIPLSYFFADPNRPNRPAA
jgi:hypothetical protein